MLVNFHFFVNLLIFFKNNPICPNNEFKLKQSSSIMAFTCKDFLDKIGKNLPLCRR